jgi:hypothetical protein
MKTLVTLFTTLMFMCSLSPAFAGPSDRQDRREVRQESEVREDRREERGRSDERQDRRECRDEEGAVGSDKRECKREEVRDGPRGSDGDDS